MSDIKSMGLYRNVDRILADLAAAGVAADGPLAVADLTPYDQYHYEGTAAVDDAITALDVKPGARLLDVGSGLGGPARYIAERTSASVTALELQSDLNATAEALTARCGLADRVVHVNGDILNNAVPAEEFSGLVSMLCFLHIPDRAALFEACARSLKAGATMFIDDYCLRRPLSRPERQALAETVYCPYLPDLDTYRSDVVGAGFEVLSATDKTDRWTTFVVGRLDEFRAARPGLIERYGADTVDGLDHFYATVAELFAGGGLTGVRLIARRR